MRRGERQMVRMEKTRPKYNSSERTVWHRVSLKQMTDNYLECLQRWKSAEQNRTEQTVCD